MRENSVHDQRLLNIKIFNFYKEPHYINYSMLLTCDRISIASTQC